jgi:hypothetical protein
LSLFTAVEAEASDDNNQRSRRHVTERTRDWVMLWVKTQTVKNAAPRGRVLKTTSILSDQRYHEGLQG